MRWPFVLSLSKYERGQDLASGDEGTVGVAGTTVPLLFEGRTFMRDR